MNRPAALAALGLVALACQGAPARADSPTPPGAPVAVPVVGSVFASGQDVPNGTLGQVTLHAVRRLPGVTIVYYSVGYAPEATADRKPPLFYASGGIWIDGGSGERVALIDRSARMVHTPLIHGALHRCVVCTDHDGDLGTETIPAGTAAVRYVGVAPLDPSVSTADVAVGDSLFVDVPVGDGPLEPQVSVGEGVVRHPQLLGTGWPVFNVSDLASAENPSTVSLRPFSENSREGEVATRRTPKTVNYDLSANVLFDKDQAAVKPAGLAAIRQLASRLAPTAKGTIRVTGYTDNLGTTEHGLELSARRANAVATVLKPLLPPGVTIQTAGKGEADPVASNETEAGRQLNRRVTIAVQEA